jgi:hypothetical protein
MSDTTRTHPRTLVQAFPKSPEYGAAIEVPYRSRGLGLATKLAIALAAVLVATAAVAQEITATMNNQSGGQIVITPRPCYIGTELMRGWMEAYTYNQSGVTIEGCWQPRDGRISVVWRGGETRTYNPVDFTFKGGQK